MIGLADRRKLREVTPGAETDPRVISAIEEMLAEPRGRSTVARSVMFTELQRRLDDEYGPGAVPVPHKRTLYRLMVHMDRGRGNFVSEASRRTAVNRPDRPFTPVTALRPGEDVPIDTNKLDIMCRYADGVIRRAELTMAVDTATRSILAGIIAPTTQAVDAAAVLARMLVPEPMRPGWPESLDHAHSVIPHERLLSIDERIANAAAKPVIIPETINCDRGRVYLSETFVRACASLGISVQPARPYTGSDKSLVERTFASLRPQFVLASLNRPGQPAWTSIILMSEWPAECGDDHDVIHLGDETAVVVPLHEYGMLAALRKRASAEEIAEAETDAAIAEHEAWKAAGRPGGTIPHEVAMTELLGGQ